MTTVLLTSFLRCLCVKASEPAFWWATVALEVSTAAITISEKVTPPFYQVYVSHFKFEWILPFPSLLLYLSFDLGFLPAPWKEWKGNRMQWASTWLGMRDVGSTSESASLSPGRVSENFSTLSWVPCPRAEDRELSFFSVERKSPK